MATVWKTVQDLIWRMKTQLHNLIWLGTPIRLENRFHPAVPEKKIIYHIDARGRLFEAKNYYALDVFKTRQL